MRPVLGIRTTKDLDSCTVALDGELDVYTSPRLKEEIVSLIDDGFRFLHVDLRGLSFIDSSGLGVLVSALRRARENDGVVRLICNNDNTLKVFKITGLDHVFPIITDAEAAES